MEYRFIAVVVLSMGLIACEDSNFWPIFDPLSGAVPFPTDLLFAGSQDGTLNMPVANPGDVTDPKVAMNALDGFSTMAPIKLGFTAAIDPESLEDETVRLFKVTTQPNGLVASIHTELNASEDFHVALDVTDVSNRTLVIFPLRPLEAKTTYLVAINDDIEAADDDQGDITSDFYYRISKLRMSLVDKHGRSRVPRLTDQQAKKLEPVRLMVNAQDDALRSFSRELARTTVLAWTFRTQSIDNALIQARNLLITANHQPSSSINPVSIGTTGSLAGSNYAAANVYVGNLNLPYYLEPASGAHDPTPLRTHWASITGGHLTAVIPGVTDVPQKIGTQSVPLFITIPNNNCPALGINPHCATKPLTGWPVIIFQHGVTRTRTDLLAMADMFAGAGFAAVAIDLPLHGGRTFNLDFVTENQAGEIIATQPDGKPDSSGRHFINLSSLLTSRDNIRQAVADLFALRAALEPMDYDADSNPLGADFDASKTHFVGHSLGAIVGVPFLALESEVSAATLGMPGGGIAKLLDGSARFGPEIAAGLEASAGLIRGTSAYEQFFTAAQMLIDSADPMNYAKAASAQHGIMMFEVIGDGETNLADQVVPNHVGTLAADFTDTPAGVIASPVSGSFPLRDQLGLTSVTREDLLAGYGISAVSNPSLRFKKGSHASLIHPGASLTATQVMQAATIGHFLSNSAGFNLAGVADYAQVLQ